MTRDPNLVETVEELRGIQHGEEVEVYKMAFGQSRVFNDQGLLAEENRRPIPRLTVAAYQIRDHSRRLLIWTWVLTGLTGVLIALTAALVYKGF
jgi:hypothetical protein